MPTPPIAAAAAMGKPVAAAMLPDSEAEALADSAESESESEFELEPEPLEEEGVAEAVPWVPGVPAVAPEVALSTASERDSSWLVARAVPLERTSERDDAAAPAEKN